MSLPPAAMTELRPIPAKPGGSGSFLPERFHRLRRQTPARRDFVSLSQGETKALFGVAGSGKSTILKLTLGLIKPDSGSIYVLGEDVAR